MDQRMIFDLIIHIWIWSKELENATKVKLQNHPEITSSVAPNAILYFCMITALKGLHNKTEPLLLYYNNNKPLSFDHSWNGF